MIRSLFTITLATVFVATSPAIHSEGVSLELVAKGSDIEDISRLRYDASANRLIGAAGSVLLGISLDGGAIDPIVTLSNRIVAIALDPTSRMAAAATTENSSVFLVDLSDGGTPGALPAGVHSPIQIAYDRAAGAFIVASESAAVLSFISGEGQTDGAVRLRGPVSGLATNGRGWLFATAADRSAVYVVDSHSRTSLGEFSVAGCNQPRFPAVDDAERRLYVVCQNGWLFALDSDTGVVLTRIPVPENVSAAVLAGTQNRSIRIVVSTRDDGLWLANGRITATTAASLNTDIENVDVLSTGSAEEVFVIHGESISRLTSK